MGTDDEVYKAEPQAKGTIAHRGIDSKNGSTRKSDILSLAVYSDEFGISGRIDIYKQDKHLLIERKNNLKHIYKGQIYQLWGQYFCMKEMGYDIYQLAFYELSTNKMTYIPLPDEDDKRELIEFIEIFKRYNIESIIGQANPNKCSHCIYCNLCDKTYSDNVYA